MPESGNTGSREMAESSVDTVRVKSEMEKELIKGIVHIARNKEFYGHVVQQLQKIFVSEDHPVQTAAVGRVPGDRFVKMYLSLEFFGAMYAKDRVQGWKSMLCVLEHEILHLVFGHLFLEFQDRTRGNVATDCVVNSVLVRDDLPGEYVHPDRYGFPINKSALWYYTHLKDNPEYQRQCADGELGVGGIMSHIQSSHGMWEDLKDDLVAKEFAKDIVRKAKDLCGGNYTNIPGEVVTQIGELLKRTKPVVPWGKVLRMFCASCQESVLEYTMKRISKRFGSRPGTRKGDVLDLAVAVDTSGSIGNNQLKLFFNEIHWIWKNGAIVTVYEADTKVQAKYKYKGKFNGDVHGRGGTDLEPVLKEVEGRHDALVYFTDFVLQILTNDIRFLYCGY
jgi:predicted metal-dependent peptidase